MTTSSMTITAANDNPGGKTSVEVHLASLVTIIAKAYVADARKKEQPA